MALAATIVWEVRTGGADTNGGGFKAGASGTDWSQQDAAQYSVTDAVTDGSTTITSASASFGADVVGNVLYIAGGTGSIVAGWYEITVRNSATSITVDRATGLTTGTGATLKIGGAILSPAVVAAAKAAGNDVWIKAGTYTVTSTTQNVTGGVVNDTTGGVDQTNISKWEGYQTTRGDLGTRPVIETDDGRSGTFTMFKLSASNARAINLSVNAKNDGTSTGFEVSATYSGFVRCKASNCAYGVRNTSSSATILILRCEATGCTTRAFDTDNGQAFFSEAYDNTAVGFYVGGGGAAVRCMSYRNRGSSVHGFVGGSVAARFISCTAYYNQGDGFCFDSNGGINGLAANCLAEANGGEGFGTDGGVKSAILLNCAGYNNTGGNYSATYLLFVEGFVALSGSAFTSVATTTGGAADFSLNATAGGGASCRAAGFPGVMPAGLSTGYLDIGAVQHQDAGGGGGTYYNGGLPVLGGSVVR